MSQFKDVLDILLAAPSFEGWPGWDSLGGSSTRWVSGGIDLRDIGVVENVMPSNFLLLQL